MSDAWGGAWGSSWGSAWGTDGDIVVKTGHADDNPRKRRIFKPTGLIDRPTRPTVDDRVEIAREVEAEVIAEATQQERLTEPPPIVTMRLADIDREIGLLMHKKMRTDDEDVTLLLLLAMTA